MIFVTGGTGILGSYLLLQLCENGNQIRALKRKSSDTNAVLELFKLYSNNAERLFKQIDWIEGSLDNIEFIDSILNDCNEIYHCAAIVSYDERKRDEIFKTNIQYTQNLVNVSLTKNIKSFCFVSSIAVLDTANNEGIIDESSEWNKEISHSSYAESKYLSEMEVWRASEEGLNVVIVNPGIILGSSHFMQSSGTIFSTHFSKNSFYTSGNAGFVDAKDTAFCMIKLMEEKQYGERFILISESKSYKEVADFLREKFNKKPSKYVPNIILKIGVYVSFILKYFIPKLNELTMANYKSITTLSKLSNQKIKKRLQFEFITVEDSLNENSTNFLKNNFE